MRRPLLARAIHGFLAIWFAVAVTEPVTLHACPVHDGAVATAGASHTTHHPNAPSAPSGERHSTSHQCACLGDCAGTAPAALVSARLTISDVATIAAPRATAVPFASHTAGPVPHARPFANGPPASHTA
ncbi:MAG: hypothetical protein ABJD07_07240 [Gemmatimonadaceae bacterium]